MSQGERAILLKISGRVQGVNFRNFAKGEAIRLGLKGWVVNRNDGTVEAALYGPGEALGKLVELCRRGPSHADVQSLAVQSADLGLVQEAPAGAYTFGPSPGP